MHRNHAVDPSGRHAATRQRHLHLGKNARVHFVAAPFFLLQDAEQASFFHLGHSFFGHLACIVSGYRAFTQFRDHGFCACDNCLCLGSQPILICRHMSTFF